MSCRCMHQHDELSMLGSCGYPDEYPQVISDIAAMGDQADKLISHRFNFDQFSDAVAMARTAASRKMKVEFEV
jgi:threonine dehydrogenase-like Zn-dependent dehydrogenase